VSAAKMLLNRLLEPQPHRAAPPMRARVDEFAIKRRHGDTAPSTRATIVSASSASPADVSRRAGRDTSESHAARWRRRSDARTPAAAAARTAESGCTFDSSAMIWPSVERDRHLVV